MEKVIIQVNSNKYLENISAKLTSLNISKNGIETEYP